MKKKEKDEISFQCYSITNPTSKLTGNIAIASIKTKTWITKK
tara:strand:+ start:422 stop:547 length:126 start_codon:yes stop_codon:yes gene_type:complete